MKIKISDYRDWLKNPVTQCYREMLIDWQNTLVRKIRLADKKYLEEHCYADFQLANNLEILTDEYGLDSLMKDSLIMEDQE